MSKMGSDLVKIKYVEVFRLLLGMRYDTLSVLGLLLPTTYLLIWVRHVGPCILG